jgi:IS5 family transposase
VKTRICNTLSVTQATVTSCHLTHHPAVHFRQRISPNLINKVNERMVEKMRSITPVQPEKKNDSDAKNESPNRGKLIVDAPSAPADITYPTDLGLLNKARVHTEKNYRHPV